MKDIFNTELQSEYFAASLKVHDLNAFDSFYLYSSFEKLLYLLEIKFCTAHMKEHSSTEAQVSRVFAQLLRGGKNTKLLITVNNAEKPHRNWLFAEKLLKRRESIAASSASGFHSNLIG